MVAAAEEGIRAGLQRAKEKLARAPERLPASHCGQGTCYSRRDVAKLIESVHADPRLVAFATFLMVIPILTVHFFADDRVMQRRRPKAAAVAA